MFDDSLLSSKALNCAIHRKEKATHLCTDLHCIGNPIICAYCLADNKYRGAHSSHEAAVKSLPEGIQIIAALIRSHSKAAETVFQRTIGAKQNQSIRLGVEKGPFLFEELQNRVQNLRIQVQLEIELLFKEFQKQVLLEKQEFARKLEEYKRCFNGNMDLIRKECGQLLAFQGQLKYYNNPNNLLLKLASQTQRRSPDWFNAQKKTLLRLSSFLENPQFSPTLVQTLSRLNRMNMLNFPFWKGEKHQAESEKELRQWLRSNLSNWVQIPQLSDLQVKNNEYISYKAMQNYYQITT